VACAPVTPGVHAGLLGDVYLKKLNSIIAIFCSLSFSKVEDRDLFENSNDVPREAEG
jgi:hypothetical protein